MVRLQQNIHGTPTCTPVKREIVNKHHDSQQDDLA